MHGNEKDECLPHLEDAEVVVGWSNTAEEECLSQDLSCAGCKLGGLGSNISRLKSLQREE